MAHAVTRGGILRGQDVRARRDPGDAGFLYLAFASVIVMGAVVFVCLWSRLTVVNLGYEISRLNETRAQALETNKRFRLELMGLKSPGRLEKIAAEEFGLRYPSPEQIVHIK
ncbi:MAG: cell division protein FtsL [Deltaproteobacteria bacterium]|nr:cell division protein FtsL [Deltaproteobacteria bacterium]